MEDGSIVLIWIFLGAIVGGIIGASKNRTIEGIVLGGILGFIGWIIIFFMSANTPQCPKCLGRIPEGAIKCMHCASDITLVKTPNRAVHIQTIERYLENCPSCGTSAEITAPANSTKCVSCGAGWVFSKKSSIIIGRTQCPNCETNFEMPRMHTGMDIECPSCKTTLHPAN